jgi:hypothetical protein
MGTFADDTAIFATHADPTTASRNLQEHLLTLQNLLQKWKIKVNKTKSSHITFTLRKDNCLAIRITQTVLPQVESVKYLGLHFDRRLNWKVHITKKRKQTYLKAKEINLLTGRKSNLSIENKLLVHKALLKPIWTYGIELWGCASKSNTTIIQRAQ